MRDINNERKVRMVRMLPPSVKYDPSTGKWIRYCPNCRRVLYGTNKHRMADAHWKKRKCRRCYELHRSRICKHQAGEIWRPIPNFEGRYEVSSRGRVKNTITGLLMKPQLTSTRRQYHSVRLWTGSGYKMMYVHRAVLLAFNVPQPKGAIEADHINCNPIDNRLKNLRWATKSQNRTHAAKMWALFGIGMHQGRPRKEKVL